MSADAFAFSFGINQICHPFCFVIYAAQTEKCSDEKKKPQKYLFICLLFMELVYMSVALGL